MTLSDLKKVDTKQFELFQAMLSFKDQSDEDFEACYSDTFMESDFGSGHVVELCPGGSQVKLTKDKIDLFVNSYVEKYFQQDRL